MSDNSSIEWCDATWNCIRGCVKVSPGCANCYAETFAERWRGVPGHAYEQGFDLRLVPEKLDEPLRWKKPRRVFVNSMSDLFQDGVPDEFIDRVFAVMALAPRHTFQVLTKRAERMRAYMSHPDVPKRVDRLTHIIAAGRLAELDAPERLVPIGGWLGYHISSKGRVFSDRTKAGTIDERQRHEVKPQYGEQGHARVMLQANGITDRLLVHRLVLWLFDRQPVGDEQGRHLDGNPRNNALWNLTWGDQLDNWADSKRHGTRRRYSKLTLEQVDQIKARLAAGESAHAIALDFGVSDTQIRNIRSGKQWQPEYVSEWPLRSVWLGVSVENQHFADERIPLLLQTPAAVRFISAEPLLEPVTLASFYAGTVTRDWLRGDTRLNWVIVGFESGHGARQGDLAWARSIVAQCQAAGCPVFVKQLGSNPFSETDGIASSSVSWNGIETKFAKGERGMDYRRLKSAKGGDPSEWPADLRIRQFPAERSVSRGTS